MIEAAQINEPGGQVKVVETDELAEFVAPINSYRWGLSSRNEDDEGIIAEESCDHIILNDKWKTKVFRSDIPVTAVLSPGDKIKTNYGTGDYIIREIHQNKQFGQPVWSFMVYNTKDECRKNKNGNFPGGFHYGYINDYIVKDGEVRHSFANNDDKIIILESKIQPITEDPQSNAGEEKELVFSDSISPCEINEEWDGLYSKGSALEAKNAPIISDLNKQKEGIPKGDKSGRKTQILQQIKDLKEEIEQTRSRIQTQFQNALEDYTQRIIERVQKEGLSVEEDDIRETISLLTDGRSHDFDGGKTWRQALGDQVIEALKNNAEDEAEIGEVLSYPPSHPWYYKLGGRILPADEIIPAQEEDEFWTAHYRKFKPAKLEQAKKDIESSLQGDIERYNEITGKGLEAISEADQKNDEMALCTALSLKHNHILAGKIQLVIVEKLLKQYPRAQAQIQLTLF